MCDDVFVCLPCVSTQFQGNVLQEAEAMLKADCGDACLRVETFFALGSPPSCDSFPMAWCQVLRNITMLLEPTDANGTETVCVIYADHQTLACTFHMHAAQGTRILELVTQHALQQVTTLFR